MTMQHPPGFGLRIPVFVAPMFLVSGPDLVIAACKAGVAGAFPTPNARPVAVLDEWLDRIASELATYRAAHPDAVTGPVCVNLITHSSNARLADDLKIVARHKPPILISALGSPRPAVEAARDWGGKVFADVTTPALARKAIAAGADGLICVCAGAGGHTGQISPFAFVRAVREFFPGPLVVGGGIADGWSLAGAIAAGADFAYVGTRFIAATESMAKQDYKQCLTETGIDDLVLSAGVTGTPALWIRGSLRANGYDPDAMPSAPARNYDSNVKVEGTRWLNVWSAGQGVGAIAAVEPLAAIVDRMEQQYRAATARIGAIA